MGILYNNGADAPDSDQQYKDLRSEMTADGITPLVAYSFLLFVLLYFPCLATIAAIRNETGTWKWAVFVAVYTTGRG